MNYKYKAKRKPKWSLLDILFLLIFHVFYMIGLLGKDHIYYRSQVEKKCAIKMLNCQVNDQKIVKDVG
jgi:tryptophan-rich sensory protein